MSKLKKDILVVGFALFAMFFGAGNLIFPPLLGLFSGDRWFSALLGFMMTGIGIPLLGIIITSQSGGSIEGLGKYIGKKASKLLGFLIILAIGPLLAIPRVAALTHEMSLSSLFPKTSPWISAVLFFS